MREAMSVNNVVKLFFHFLKINKNILTKKGNFKEANLLKLNSNKAIQILQWKNRWNMKKSIQETAKWYKNYLTKKDVKKTSIIQIREYFNK